MFIKKFFIRHWRIISIEVLLLIVTVNALYALHSEKNTIFIAVVAPLNGEQNIAGNTVVDSPFCEKPKNSIWGDVVCALELYAERVNKYGGIKGKKLKILPYDDEGNPEIAREKAREIVSKKDKFVAVLGHFSNETTQNAIDIYDKAKIPMLAPISNITSSSKWIFQILPAPEGYGEYMAHYIKKILLKDSITIIRSKKQDDAALVESFIKTFKKLGGRVEKEPILLNAEIIETEINNIIRELGTNNANHDNNGNMLLLAAQTKEAISLIIALKKDKKVKAPIMSIDTALGEKIGKHLKNKQYSSRYFSDGIYVPSTMFLEALPNPDLALVRKDYETGHKGFISHMAMNAVLSASFIVESLNGSEMDNVKSMRNELQSKLKDNKWFENGKGIESNLFLGVFKGPYLVIAPVNPTVINVGDLADLERESNNNNLLEIHGRNLYATDFVYTGISMNKISDIDIDNLIYSMDFFLWFRYGDKLTEVDDIEFLNTIKPERLYAVLAESKKDESKKDEKNTVVSDDKMTASLVESSFFNGENYRRYHIKGRFKTPNPKNYALGQQNMYVKFRHYASNKYKLSYVPDFMNTNNGIFDQEEYKGSTFDIEESKFNVIEDESLTLNYNFTYISNSKKTMLGNPEGIAQSNDFSQFIAEYRTKPARWSFRGVSSWINAAFSKREDQIDMVLMTLLLSASSSIFIFALYGERKKLFDKTSIYWWLLQSLAIFFTLLFGELLLSQSLFDLKYTDWGKGHRDTIGLLMLYMEYTIAILWWIIPTHYITSAFEQFLWQPIKKRTGAEVPHVLRQAIAVFIYLLAALGIMAFVFKVTVTSLAATSGVIAIIFAIASKVDLSNIIAGLGISFSKMFKLGDWVKIDTVEGQVVEMTPRSTKVLTFNSSIINIPNMTVSNAIIENYTHPDPVFRLVIHLETVPVYRFERVEKVLLDAVSSTENVLDKPQPYVIFKGQGDSCQIYEIAFFIDNYAKRHSLWQAAWRRIWRHLEQADITLATPQREVFMPEAAVEDVSAPLTVINNCGAFSKISNEAKIQLAQKSHLHSYASNAVILRQGDANNSLFIITEGVVSFDKKSETGDLVEIKRLGVAEVFGQLSLLNCKMIDATAIAKTDTELFEIKKEDFIMASAM